MDDFLSLLKNCELCPRRCRVNRLMGKGGFCGIADEIIIAHFGAHFGEEPPISGTKGSGNIFFASCNLRCVYCQNYQISHKKVGKQVSIQELVEIFFHLEREGCHNINLVSPTPYIPLIAASIVEAKKNGINIPFVYNTNAYVNVQSLKILDGLIDIYLPDFKYWNPQVAKRLSDTENYPEYAQLSIFEMKNQVGNLYIEDGIALRGILVRHLVLPSNLAGSKRVLAWIKNTLGSSTFISLMSQYYPLHKASMYPMLNRKITQEEYDGLIDFLTENCFENVFIQELESAPLYAPDFSRAEPFKQVCSME